MRKQTKLVAVASAAALLAIGASMTSFAATGWVEEGGEWFFYDNDGTKVEDDWKKSGDKWFWLDSEESGAMATDKLVSDDEDTYYVDSTGSMVSNTWVKVVNEDQDEDEDPAEYNYYYMQGSGKAHKASSNSTSTKFKTIDGKRYAFDEDGKMLYGWVDGNAERLTGESEWAATGGTGVTVYYLGNWDDGAMKTGWQKINVYDDDEDVDRWFYFNSNGKRFYNDDSTENFKEKTVNGKKYGFDERGVMVNQWNVASPTIMSSASGWNYFNSPEDGARVSKGWFKVIPPTADTTFTDSITDANSFDAVGADDEDVNWYYADGEGDLYESAIKKIKGKYYGFHTNGKMLNGLVFMDVNPLTGEIREVYDGGVDSDELSDIIDSDLTAYSSSAVSNPDASLYYFGSDADSDGAMKTGNVTVNLDGDNYSFLFSTTGGVESRGRGVTGIDDNKYIYKYGQRIKAGSDEKYVVVSASGNISDNNVTVLKEDSRVLRTNADSIGSNKDGEKVRANIDDFNANHYLVNTSGTIAKNKTAAKDGDDWYFYVDANRNVRMYTNYKEFKVSTGVTTELTHTLVDGTVLTLKDWKTWAALPPVTVAP